MPLIKIDIRHSFPTDIGLSEIYKSRITDQLGKVTTSRKPPWLSGSVVRHVSTRYCIQTSVSAWME